MASVNSKSYDVIVVGAGNAAMCAAITALETGAKVAILEKAPRTERGGNSALTVTMRIATDDWSDLEPLLGTDVLDADLEWLKKQYRPLSSDALRDEMLVATSGQSDSEMLDVYVDRAWDTVRWLAGLGHRWVRSIDPTSLNPLMMEGRGFGYQTRNFRFAEERGGEILYETTLCGLVEKHGRVVGIDARTKKGVVRLSAPAVVLACGGFEASPEMRTRYLGPHWDTVRIRGVPFNTGDGLRIALGGGAMPTGGWGSCHASPQDWRLLPPYGLPSQEETAEMGGFGRSRYSYPFGILVNRSGRRFVDEAENVRGMTYAKVGERILAQEGGKAFQIFDAKARRQGLLPRNYETATGARADTLGDLAEVLGVDGRNLEDTISAFNAAVPDGEARPSPQEVDGHGTVGLEINKSNYAMTLDEPPYEGYAVRCGMTFTFGGLKIIPQTGQVVHVSGHPIEGLYAAGEIVGGLFYGNYPGGSGMASGAVFGRIAGANAARSASTEVLTPG